MESKIDRKYFEIYRNTEYLETQYLKDRQLFFIDNSEKSEKDFIEYKIKNRNSVIEENKRMWSLSDEEFYIEYRKRPLNLFMKVESTYTKDEEKELYFKNKMEFDRQRYKPLEFEDHFITFYKTKLKSLPDTESAKEEIEQEEKTPYKIALLKELGFFDLDKIKNTSKENRYKIIQKIIGGSLRSVKGNVLVLNPESNEDRTRYTVNSHLESVKNYLDKLK